MDALTRQRETPALFPNGSARSAWRFAVLAVMRFRLASSPLRCLLLGALLSTAAMAQQPAGGAAEQRRLQLLGTQSREIQLAPANQAFLVAYVRRAALLYLHRLDNLSCRPLFGMGDQARFLAVIGSDVSVPTVTAAVKGRLIYPSGWPDETVPNRVFIEGDRSPRHPDDGPYIFPANTWEKYWPASTEFNTYWHEAQHPLLLEGGVGINPAPYRARMLRTEDDDEHHAFIEGVGQRGSEAYVELLAFEDAVRRADRLESQWMAEGRDPAEDYGLQRQAWGEAHQQIGRAHV